MKSTRKTVIMAGAGLSALLAISGCQTTPPQPMPSTLPADASMQQLLDEAAMADLGAQQCQAYGGIRAPQRLNDLAQSDYAKARAMGASDQDVRKAQIRAEQRAKSDQIVMSNQQACNDLLSLGQDSPFNR